MLSTFGVVKNGKSFNPSTCPSLTDNGLIFTRPPETLSSVVGVKVVETKEDSTIAGVTPPVQMITCPVLPVVPQTESKPTPVTPVEPRLWLRCLQSLLYHPSLQLHLYFPSNHQVRRQDRLIL